MHFNCGVMFVELLKIIKRNNIQLRNTNEVANKFKKFIPHLFENYKQVFNETSERIDFLYPQDTSFKNVNIWLKKVFKKGYDYRNKHCNFLARIMDLPKEKCVEYFVALINEFGFPALCDKNNNIFSSECNMSLALVPIAIYNIFKSTNAKCYLYEYCKAGKNSEMNENCISAPWLQSDRDMLCPFALFWYRYGLDGKIIKR